MSKSCGNCGADLVDNAKYCDKCGTKATNDCSSCGTILGEEDMFCPSCGHATGVNIATPAVKNQTDNRLFVLPGPDPYKPSTGNLSLDERLKPRSYFKTKFVIFITAYLISTLGFSFLMPYFRGLKFDIETFFGMLLFMGITVGPIFGFAFARKASSGYKEETICLNFVDKNVFIKQIKKAMFQVGFGLDTESSDFITFKCLTFSGIIPRKFSVLLEDNVATVLGFSFDIKELKKKLG